MASFTPVGAGRGDYTLLHRRGQDYRLHLSRAVYKAPKGRARLTPSRVFRKGFGSAEPRPPGFAACTLPWRLRPDPPSPLPPTHPSAGNPSPHAGTSVLCDRSPSNAGLSRAGRTLTPDSP